MNAYLSLLLGIAAVVQAVVVWLIVSVARRISSWRLMWPFVAGYGMMLAWRLVSLFGFAESGTLDLLTDGVFPILIALPLAYGLWTLVSYHLRFDQEAGGNPGVQVLSRYPFDRAFFDAVVGYAVVSAANRDGDRLWGWMGDPKEGRWLRVNQAFADLIGYSAAELQDLTMADIAAPDDRGRDVHREMKSGRVSRYQTEKVYRRRDGSFVPVKLAVSAIRAKPEGPILYYLAQFTDLGPEHEEHARLERALRAVEYERDTLMAIAKGRTEPQSDNVTRRLHGAKERLDRLIQNLREETSGVQR